MPEFQVAKLNDSITRCRILLKFTFSFLQNYDENTFRHTVESIDKCTNYLFIYLQLQRNKWRRMMQLSFQSTFQYPNLSSWQSTKLGSRLSSVCLYTHFRNSSSLRYALNHLITINRMLSMIEDGIVRDVLFSWLVPRGFWSKEENKI